MAKSLQDALRNFEASIPGITEKYIAGISQADWRGPSLSREAATNYQQGVQAAISSGARERGIQGVTNESWRESATSKADRLSSGMSSPQALAKWEANFGPVYSAILQARSSLRPRTQDIAANVQNRVLPIAQAARAAGRKGRRSA